MVDYLRQPAESAKAYQAFVAYRDLGPRRTLRETAEKVGKSASSIEKWSRQHRWVERCCAWAEHQEAESRRQQLAAIHEMNERHIAIAKSLQAKAIDKLNSMSSGAASLTPREALAFLELAMKVERLSCGAPANVSQRRIETERSPGRMSRAVLESEEALTKALDLLDVIAAA